MDNNSVIRAGNQSVDKEDTNMKHRRNLAGLAIILLCSGCGGGGGGNGGSGDDNASQNGPSHPSETPVVTGTADLVASKDFDFRSDRTITLNFNSFPSSYGKFVVYGRHEYFDRETATYFPDYATRIASFIANPELDYQFNVPGTQRSLVIEWLPMDGLSNEAYHLVNLTSAGEYQVQF